MYLIRLFGTSILIFTVNVFFVKKQSEKTTETVEDTVTEETGMCMINIKSYKHHLKMIIIFNVFFLNFMTC